MLVLHVDATLLLYRWSRVAMEHMHGCQHAYSKVTSSAGIHANAVAFEGGCV